jgi:hypothetical protein
VTTASIVEDALFEMVQFVFTEVAGKGGEKGNTPPPLAASANLYVVVPSEIETTVAVAVSFVKTKLVISQYVLPICPINVPEAPVF